MVMMMIMVVLVLVMISLGYVDGDDDDDGSDVGNDFTWQWVIKIRSERMARQAIKKQ